MKPFIALKFLREELEELPRDLCSAECIDFILYLLNLDYQNRPTASEALKHRYIRSVELLPQQVGISDRGFHLRTQVVS
jgi:serine/threonine protein kinase